MKKLKILRTVLVRTRAMELLISYLLFFLLSALIVTLAEPEIHSYGQGLWYCYAVMSTVGFGDLVAVTLLGRLVSVLLTLYSLVIIALVTGVIVNFYSQLIQLRQKESLAAFADKLQRLPELSREELEIMSEQAKQFLQNR